MADEPLAQPHGDALLNPPHRAVPAHTEGWRALLRPSLLITAAAIVFFDQATKALAA